MKNDGGPAFPGIEGSSGNGNATPIIRPDGGYEWITHNQGLSLRDYFAAKAMHALIIDGEYDRCANGPESLPEYAYQIADAMLAERAKQP